MLFEIQKPEKYIDSFLLEKESGFHFYYDGDKAFMQGDGTENEALVALEAHNPIQPSEPDISQKLASVGLSVEELKIALGLS